MALRVGLSHESAGFQLSKQDRCVKEGCHACSSNTWRLGVGINYVPLSSGWSTKNINLDDPIEVALAGELQFSALAHVTASTSHAYVGPCNAFVLWCSNLLDLVGPYPLKISQCRSIYNHL